MIPSATIPCTRHPFYSPLFYPAHLRSLVCPCSLSASFFFSALFSFGSARLDRAILTISTRKLFIMIKLSVSTTSVQLNYCTDSRNNICILCVTCATIRSECWTSARGAHLFRLHFASPFSVWRGSVFFSFIAWFWFFLLYVTFILQLTFLGFFWISVCLECGKVFGLLLFLVLNLSVCV